MPATPTTRRRCVIIGAGVAVLCLLGASTASAHLRSGTVAVDYRATISRPATAAYSAQIYQSDHGLTLTRRPGHVVVMLGYLGEPVFRLDDAGLWVNSASPTAAALHLVSRARAVAAATPRWQLHRDRHSVLWHDARVQQLPPRLDHGSWTVPLIIDGRRAALQGELRRVPPPSPWPWLGELACWLAAGAAVPLMRRRDLARPAATGFACVAAGATVVIAFAFALDPYASPGTWIEGLDAITFLGVGLAVLRRGPRNLHVAGAIWIGLISVAVGLLEGAIFLHPIVLAILPGAVTRALAVAAVGAGLDAVAVGFLRFEEIADRFRYSPPSFDLGPPRPNAPAPPGRDPFGS